MQISIQTPVSYTHLTLDVNDNLDISGTLTSGTANAFIVDATGNVATTGTTGLSFTSTGGIVLAGGTITDGTDGVDINDDLEIAGGTTLGDASGDTVTANAGSWTFANDTNYILSGGINGLSLDSTTFSVDATNDRIGIGTACLLYTSSQDQCLVMHLILVHLPSLLRFVPHPNLPDFLE